MGLKICFPFVGDSMGGSNISSLNLIKKLNKKGHDVKIVLHKRGFFFNYLKKNNVKFEYIKIDNLAGQNSNFLNIIFLMLKNFFVLKKYLKKNRFNIIHGNDLRINLNWSFACFGTNKYIWHQRNYVKPNSLLFLPMYFLSAKIIAISNTVFNNFPKKIKQKSKVIFNPFEKVKFKNKTNKKKINIAFLGRPSFLKGFDIFTQICEKLKNNKKFVFNVYGSQFENKKKDIFELKGFCKIQKIISENDILIAPSRREGFGRSLIEFAISGKKVIASKISAHKEINDNFSKIFLVENEYQNYIEKVKHLKNYKKKNKKRNLKKLDSKYHFEQVIKLYYSVI